MRAQILVAVRAAVVTLVLTGIIYPLVITGAAQALFPRAANGSLVQDDRGATVGSALIGQLFTNPAYLQGRPSAAGNGYDPTASGGSNLGPTSKKLRDRAAADVVRLRRENPGAPLPIPAELVTTSASGLDPELSPTGAFWQVSRIARARQVSPERIRAVIAANVDGRDFGIFGEPRVNVLAVNLALDRQFGMPTARPKAAPAASN